MKKASYDFTQWAGRLETYFGRDIVIYNHEGVYMCGDTCRAYRSPASLQEDRYIRQINQDIGTVCAYIDTANLTYTERQILDTIIPFIESNIEKEAGVI